MKTQIITIVCIVLGTSALLGFRSGLNSQNIENAIKQECTCDKIVHEESLHGITFSHDLGMNIGDTYNITLQNCTFDTVENEMERLTTIISTELNDSYRSDIFILEFQNDEEITDNVIIQNNKWTAMPIHK